MNQQMNIGQFIAAEIIILIVLASIEKLILSLESIYDILTALEKLASVTDLELERETGMAIPHSEQGLEVELRNVSFTYPDNRSETLSNISMSLKKGEKCVITGQCDSGKNTLLHIIAGLFDVQQGNILYNGLPTGNLSLDSMRESIGDHITSETLFEGTVIENISLGRENVSFEDVEWATVNLGLSEFIKDLPQGYDTRIGTQGKGLSESTITLLLIARSIVGRPKLLLLENSLEHLDGKRSRQVIDFLTSDQHGWTFVAVSSNDYLGKCSDTILVLKNGQILASGNYDRIKGLANFKTSDHA